MDFEMNKNVRHKLFVRSTSFKNIFKLEWFCFARLLDHVVGEVTIFSARVPTT